MKFALVLIALASSYAAYVPGSQVIKDFPERHPVIFVPGDGGCQLKAKLNKPSTVHLICEKETQDYFTLWLNIEQLVPIIIDCWVDNVKLNYDNVTRTTSNQPGVDIIVPGFGDPATVEWLDPLKLSVGAYFKDIANALVEELGYERNLNIRGAPFDFRKAPNEMPDYLIRLRMLVEESYLLNGNKSVILMGHSMGAPMATYFLQQMSQEWKDKYIQSLITLSGAYAGTFKSIKAYLMGDNLNVFLLPENTLMQVQRTMPSIGWLMPSPLFWKPNEVLVQTNEKNYSLSNLEELFNDLDYPTGWEIVKDQMQYRDFTAPGVEVHCMHGVEVDTYETVTYGEGGFPNGKYTFSNGDGDGTVNRRSLESCLHWRGQQPKEVYHTTYSNANHNGILADQRAISYIVDHLRGLIED